MKLKIFKTSQIGLGPTACRGRGVQHPKVLHLDETSLLPFLNNIDSRSHRLQVTSHVSRCILLEVWPKSSPCCPASKFPAGDCSSRHSHDASRGKEGIVFRYREVATHGEPKAVIRRSYQSQRTSNEADSGNMSDCEDDDITKVGKSGLSVG